MKKFSLLFVFMIFCISCIKSFVYGKMLTIDNYLAMIAKNNNEWKSIQAEIDAIKGKLDEIERVYVFSFTAGISYSDDKSGRPYSQSLKLDDLINWKYDASLNKQFETGTKVYLGVDGSYGTYDYVNTDKYSIKDIVPFVKLEQSLWKDINGGSTKASIAKQKASARSQLYLYEYKKQKFLLDAIKAYWDLSYARTIVDFKIVSFDRKKKILEWNQRRYKMDLVEKSDLLQSQAAVKSGELNLKIAYEDESKNNRTFNLFININEDNVRYDVEKFEDKGNSFKVDKDLLRKGTRADVLSALEDVNAALYDQEVSQRSRGADLVFEGKYAFNNVAQNQTSKSFERIKDGDRSSYSIGLRYTLPLDFKLRKVIDKGYEAAKIAAQSSAESVASKENNDWIQLLDNWNNTRIRLEVAFDIEKIQRQRYEEDRKLLQRGRTTTYMVLQSEEDLDSSTLNVLKGILELIKIDEEVKAFYSGVNEVL
ncbi:MAG: TolC family protein [Endomicrobium sp.]|jgi:outer membrane protein TolC|nr:TolC family protein [Endomicrobium sp.]